MRPNTPASPAVPPPQAAAAAAAFPQAAHLHVADDDVSQRARAVGAGHHCCVGAQQAQAVGVAAHRGIVQARARVDKVGCQRVCPLPQQVGCHCCVPVLARRHQRRQRLVAALVQHRGQQAVPLGGCSAAGAAGRQARRRIARPAPLLQRLYDGAAHAQVARGCGQRGESRATSRGASDGRRSNSAAGSRLQGTPAAAAACPAPARPPAARCSGLVVPWKPQKAESCGLSRSTCASGRQRRGGKVGSWTRGPLSGARGTASALGLTTSLTRFQGPWQGAQRLPAAYRAQR